MRRRRRIRPGASLPPPPTSASHRTHPPTLTHPPLRSPWRAAALGGFFGAPLTKVSTDCAGRAAAGARVAVRRTSRHKILEAAAPARKLRTPRRERSNPFAIRVAAMGAVLGLMK